MKRSSDSQRASHEDQKRPRPTLASDQSGRSISMSVVPDQAAGDSSNTGQSSSPAGPNPRIVVQGAEDIQQYSGLIGGTPEPPTTYEVFERFRRSPSSRQDSPTSLSASGYPQSPIEESFIPSTITYSLRLIFECKGCPDAKLADEMSVHLHRPESYQEIERVADEHAERTTDEYKKALSTDSFSLKEPRFFYGNCTIASNNSTKFRLPLRSLVDWAEVNKQIVGYWNEHTNERLHLYISRHYLASQEQPNERESLAKVKACEIGDLRKQTWEEKHYVSCKALKTLISDQTIDRIIKEELAKKESSLKSMSPDEQHAFTHQVQAEGRILFAMCVHARLKLKCLKKLLDSGRDDSTLPLQETSQCHEGCRQKFGSLVNAQGGFRAEHFREGEHKKLDAHAVVPLHFCPRAQGKDDLEWESNGTQIPSSVPKAIRTAALCGSGACSTVYCVTLDPSHHSLSADLDGCFALKELTPRLNLAQNFEGELAMLRVLREFPHAHIMTHLATWTRDEKYYMLFPYAQCDLRKYMKQNAFAKEDALWLMDQLRGMAEAVRHVHNLFPATISPPEERRTAWHHDIKPENILFFRDHSSRRGLFRLSDWGTAKVNPYRTRSYNTRSPIGTLTYEPPEYTKDGMTSRPYDVWSLGCVYLELLVWAVFGSKIVEDFSDQREDKRDANSETGSTRDDAFWQKVGGEFKLRSTVVDQLKNLDEALEKPGALPFKEVVRHIRRMLEPDQHKRIKARKLCELLDITSPTKSSDAKSPRDESEAAIQFPPTASDHLSPDAMVHGHSPSGRVSGSAYAEHLNLSPSGMSPRANQNRRNSSAGHSRQSSNASVLSTLSLPDRGSGH